MNQIETKQVVVPIKAYSTKEIAVLYDVSKSTMKRWLIPFKDEIGPRCGHYYNPKQMKVIFTRLGTPEVAI